MNARIDPMTVMPELVTLENKADESDVLVQVVQGKMTLGTLVQHAEQLQSSGHLVAASNLYKLWIKHTEDDKALCLFQPGLAHANRERLG
jgi:hypothetical protein